MEKLYTVEIVFELEDIEATDEAEAEALAVDQLCESVTIKDYDYVRVLEQED